MATMKVTDASFEADVLGSETPVVVDFWAEWCGPCRMIGPALEEIADELADKVKVVKVNIDEEPEWASKFNVRSIPTLLVFKGGEKVAEKLGAAPKSALKSWVEGAL
ncbi:thioredoxin [Sandaracinobacter sp. RS1-74]|uniref:thioredoxin n=1 Tax=Sandaracinobacteroides sayramensis TaxID=2913411 RepID=UPI001EDC8F32|nr:thioredoxin [Sandaracinobacteroides sayramensis]MCG2840820.1 thioredoxin [Sandaracinobacteroides sayramensis]